MNSSVTSNISEVISSISEDIVEFLLEFLGEVFAKLLTKSNAIFLGEMSFVFFHNYMMCSRISNEIR